MSLLKKRKIAPAWFDSEFWLKVVPHLLTSDDQWSFFVCNHYLYANRFAYVWKQLLNISWFSDDATSHYQKCKIRTAQIFDISKLHDFKDLRELKLEIWDSDQLRFPTPFYFPRSLRYLEIRSQGSPSAPQKPLATSDELPYLEVLRLYSVNLSNVPNLNHLNFSNLRELKLDDFRGNLSLQLVPQLEVLHVKENYHSKESIATRIFNVPSTLVKFKQRSYVVVSSSKNFSGFEIFPMGLTYLHIQESLSLTLDSLKSLSNLTFLNCRVAETCSTLGSFLPVSLKHLVLRDMLPPNKYPNLTAELDRLSNLQKLTWFGSARFFYEQYQIFSKLPQNLKKLTTTSAYVSLFNLKHIERLTIHKQFQDDKILPINTSHLLRKCTIYEGGSWDTFADVLCLYLCLPRLLKFGKVAYDYVGQRLRFWCYASRHYASVRFRDISLTNVGDCSVPTAVCCSHLKGASNCFSCPLAPKS